MGPWDAFEHHGAYNDLKAIVFTATSMGAQIGSCGERKLTIRWPNGCVVHIRRYLDGRFRWLLFTHSDCRAIFLSNRDPSISELQRAAAACDFH
jgi:hypothetical protein